MARKAISGTRARRNVRIAQMAGVALGVTAAALWILRVPGLENSLPQKPVLQPVSMQEIRPVAQLEPMDRETLLGVAERMELAANIERKPDSPTPDPTPVPTAASAEWKYIAPIREPNRMLAVVSRGGKQKIMSPGREWEGATLISLNEKEMVVEDSSGRHTIARGERSGPSVQWAKLPTNDPGMGNDAMSKAEELAVMRGAEATQAAAIRQAGKDGRARGVPLPAGALREFGISPEEAAKLSPDEVQEMRMKYESISRERNGEDGAAQPERPTAVDDGAVN